MSPKEFESSLENTLTGEVIGVPIEVHRELGPGLLESANEQCICHDVGGRAILRAAVADPNLILTSIQWPCR